LNTRELSEVPFDHPDAGGAADALHVEGQANRRLADGARALVVLGVVQQGELLTWLGRPEEGIEWIRKAMRLNPYHPERFWGHLGRAYFVAGQYREAIAAFQNIDALDHSQHAFLAAANIQNGDEGAARAHAGQVLALQADFSIASYLETMHYAREEDRAHHREALLKAGLPA